MCLKQTQLQNLCHHHMQKNTYFTYVKCILIQQILKILSLTSKKLQEKYDVSFIQEAPTNHYLLQTLTKPTYEFHKPLIGKLSKYNFITCKVIQLCNTGRLNF